MNTKKAEATVPFWNLRYEFVRHLDGCFSIGGNGDKDCTCGAVAFLDGLDASCELLGKARKALQALSTPPKVGSGELDAAGVEDWRAEIKHPNNRLLFRRMVEKAGIDLETDDIASALKKVAALSAPVDHPEVVGDAVAHIVTDPKGRRRVTLADKYDPMSSAFWINGERPEGYSVTPLFTRALQPSDSPALEAGVTVTDAMVERALDEYLARLREYDRDFNSDEMTGEKWKAKYGTNLHSTGLGERWAMRAALSIPGGANG
ncbi:hypothetical protein [Mesorhizobium sp. M0129]|uniref:hypothetical protein n=1 Tax=Mesorhizobium sp. M0129 TaxID=2956886 RepID=UPI003335E526